MMDERRIILNCIQTNIIDRSTPLFFFYVSLVIRDGDISLIIIEDI